MKRIEQITTEGKAHDALNSQVALIANSIKNKRNKLYKKVENYFKLKEEIKRKYSDFDTKKYDGAVNAIIKIKLEQQDILLEKYSKKLEEIGKNFFNELIN